MVAAATTSLPERAEQGRDYDYRYAWIRDQCFTGQALRRRGRRRPARARGRVRPRPPAERRAAPRPAYTVDGGPVPDQRRLDLPGYPGAPG